MDLTELREALPQFADNDDEEGLVAFIAQNEATIMRDFVAAWNAGWSLRRLKLLEHAARLLEAAIQLDPAKATGPYALAVVKGEIGERLLAEAEDLYRESIRVKENWGARLGLAVLLLERGRGEEGEQLLREGVSARPQSRMRQEELADYLEDRGKLAEADAVRKAAAALPDEDRTD